MNPCGHICDYGRRPYTTRARLFRGSDDEVALVWYKANQDNPVLPFRSAITMSEWATDQLNSPKVGESADVAKVYNGQWSKPEATGARFCGTPADFRFGCPWLPFDPPVVYYPNGLPTCCMMLPIPTYPGPHGLTFNAIGQTVLMTLVDASKEWVYSTISGDFRLRSPLYDDQGSWKLLFVWNSPSPTVYLSPVDPGWEGYGQMPFRFDPPNPPTSPYTIVSPPPPVALGELGEPPPEPAGDE